MRPRVADVTFDDAGQLAFFDHDANKDRSLRYDGRGFLSTLADASGSIDLLRPAYSSEGLLHSLLREPTSLSPHRLNVLYFAGRPIGIWKKVGTSTATLTRIVTDHLGTPVASLQQAGATLDWHGGFEPFGEDWQAGTLQDSLTKGIFLRMPGQWKDPLWSDATYPMELFYNVHRWYEPGTGRYASADPFGLSAGVNLHHYAVGNPISFTDPDGRYVLSPGLTWPFKCAVMVADWTRARVAGAGGNEWPWAHCWASCMISRVCGGPRLAKAFGYAKEVVDVPKCFGQILFSSSIGPDGNCGSAFQPSDFEDNSFGISCPEQQSCDERCEPLIGKSPKPGPMYWVAKGAQWFLRF